MQKLRVRTAAALLSLALAGAFVNTVQACSVPVFRYGLERWDADPYEAVIFYRKALSAQDSAVVKSLKMAHRKPTYANLRVSLIDVAGKLEDAQRRRWQVQDTSKVPLVALYPLRLRRDKPPVWSAPLSAAVAKQVLNSPIRREIARRLLAGETAVWVVVPSGDKKRDRALMDSLRTNLSAMEKTLKIPEPVHDASYFEPAKGVPLKIAFSTLVLSPRDPSEQILLSMMWGKRFVADSLSGPVAIPVFGRGRALITLPDKKVIKRHIEEVCRFLAGPCACTVKQANPGTDVLYSVDWDGALRVDPNQQEPLPPLSGFSRFIETDTSDTTTKVKKAR